MKKVRTRYAPSPTGYLHIGGARTALFNYLFAKHHQGKFIIRIEDTDTARNITDGEKSQLENLSWLNISFDESPLTHKNYRQSEKLDRYNQLIDQLIDQNQAYKAYDTPEELEQQRQEQIDRKQFSFRYDRNWLIISDEEKAKRDQAGKFVIRLAMKPNTVYSWEDMVRGKIEVNTNDIGDWVIRKQNGYPTYNFAVVVDDYDMEISHVLRGEEHTTNTPKQLAVYDAFDWKPPNFGHLTIITNHEGQKLSKRDTSVKQFIEDYKKEGYVPEAIFNFLTLLGWTHPEAKEVMDQQEIIKSFDYKRLSKSPSKFDIKKMNWFAKEYLKNVPNSEIITKLEIKNRSEKWQNLFVSTYKQSSTTINQIKQELNVYDDKTVKKCISSPVLEAFKSNLEQVEFNVDSINDAIKRTSQDTGAKGKKLFQPIRQATTYQDHGPELAKSIFLFGEKLIKERLK